MGYKSLTAHTLVYAFISDLRCAFVYVFDIVGTSRKDKPSLKIYTFDKILRSVYDISK